jgi:uncharacterized protein YbjT (DUF2867 family)
VARHADRAAIPDGEHAAWATADIDDETALARAFTGCESVIHCAGINLERGSQTYAKVHVRGTEKIVHAARTAGVRRIALVSFLRARPACGSAYHESKWAAEELVRSSVTVPVLGPEELTLASAVQRVASVIGLRPRYIPAPAAVHRVLAWVLERVMTIPLVSAAQVRILAEGITAPTLAPDRSRTTSSL